MMPITGIVARKANLTGNKVRSGSEDLPKL
jgi:hypothetical protein